MRECSNWKTQLRWPWVEFQINDNRFMLNSLYAYCYFFVLGEVWKILELRGWRYSIIIKWMSAWIIELRWNSYKHYTYVPTSFTFSTSLSPLHWDISTHSFVEIERYYMWKRTMSYVHSLNKKILSNYCMQITVLCAWIY